MSNVNVNATNVEQWAEGFLQYLGHPATSVNDPRLKFLIAWDTHEGDVQSNPTNGLAIEDGGPTMSGSKVSAFKNIQDGYVALHKYLVNNGITGVLQGLTNPASTVESLTHALAGANWEGSATPEARAASLNYANSVGQAAGGTTIVQPLKVGGTGAPPATTPGALGVAQQTLGMKENYTGPGAYKGFDLSSLSGSLVSSAKAAIDQFTATPGAEQSMMQKIYQNYGNEAWAASIPELRSILVLGAYMGWNGAAGTAELQSAFQNTKWWKQSSDNGRLWQETLANDPGQAKVAVQEAASRVTNIANSLGVQLDEATLQKIATTVAQQSVSGIGQFSSTQFTDSQIYQAVTGAVNSTQFTNQLTEVPGAPPLTGASAPVTAVTTSGDAASLQNAFTTIARNYYLNLTPQQIAAKVQEALASDTGEGNFQSGALASFTSFAQNQAKMMYPTLAASLGTTTSVGADNTPYQSMAWARNMIASFTGQGSGDNINLTDPQWNWILSGTTPPKNIAAGITPQSSTSSTAASGTPTNQIPSADTLQSYLMQTPQYQTTNQAKNQAWQIGSAVTKSFGYN